MKQVFSFFIAISIVILHGCSGSLQGVVRREAQRVQFTYTDSGIGKGSLQTVLPDGERFEGKLVKISSNKPDGKSGSVVTAGETANFHDVQSFNGNTEATLTGNQGNVMKCRFRLTDTIIGLSGGGFGICQTADGRVIDIYF